MRCSRSTALLCIVIMLGMVHGSKDLEATSSTPAVERFKVTVEVAIFCDVKFSSIFDNDNEKLVNYWTQIMRNVDLRFKTLKNVDISFRVNSITKLQDCEEKQLTEGRRASDGTYSLGEILQEFGKLLYEMAILKIFTGYDIAVLALRSKFSDAVGMAMSMGGACSVDVFERKVESAVAVSMWNQDLVVGLAHEFGHILGAPHDDNEEDYKLHDCEEFNITDGEYIMGNGKYFFSPCSQKLIFNFLESEKASCLKHTHEEIVPIIDTSVHCNEKVRKVSSEEHCQILVDYHAAYVTLEENNCLEAKCHVNLGNKLFTGNTTFDLLDYTRCKANKENGICVFGTCIPSGNYLVNVASGKCIGLKTPFSSEIIPVLYDCLEGGSSPPWNTFRLKDVTYDKRIVTLIIVNLPGNTTKYLSLEEETIVLQESENDFRNVFWYLRKNEEHHKISSGSFVLYHPLSKSCLAVADNYTVFHITKNCSAEDTKQRWRLISENDYPVHSSCKRARQKVEISNSVRLCSQAWPIFAVSGMLIPYLISFLNY